MKRETSNIIRDISNVKPPFTSFVSFVFPFVFVFLSSCAPEVVQHNATGNAHFEAGEYAQAVAAYRQAQVEAPDQAEPYYNAANAYNRQAQLDATITQAQQALKTADPALATQAWYNLGNAYFDAQQWPDAIAAYQETLRLNPDDQDAKHNLELALQKLKEQQQEQEQEQQDQEEQEQQDEEKEQKEGDQEGEQEQNQGSEEGATPTPASESEGSEEQEQEATPEPSEHEQTAGEMTPQQALQLLQALMSESETLQERLQQIYRAPGAPPEEDW